MRKLKQLSKSGKGGNFEMVVSLSRQRWIHVLIFIGVLYWIFLIRLQVPFVSSIPQEPVMALPYNKLKLGEESQLKAPSRPLKQWISSPDSDLTTQTQLTTTLLSNISFDAKTFTPSSENGVLQLHRVANMAFEVGRKLWEELESGNIQIDTKKKENLSESCPHSIIFSGSEFLNKNVMILPCGLTLWSHITVVGVPRAAHVEKNPNFGLMNDGEEAIVSQFVMELRGLKTVEGEEEPPIILHFNPRLKGDFSGKPVIEQNTCYRMQWGTALRCQGLPSRADEETGKIMFWVHNWKNGRGIWNLETGNLKKHFDKYNSRIFQL